MFPRNHTPVMGPVVGTGFEINAGVSVPGARCPAYGQAGARPGFGPNRGWPVSCYVLPERPLRER